MLAVSYNPGYQSVLKDLKPSTRQRFVALSFNYPEISQESEIVTREGGIDHELAHSLVKLATMTRSLKDSGLQEGASTRLLIQAGKLIAAGVDIPSACRAAVVEPLSDDPELLAAVEDMVSSLF
jgi:nitric oxide reductase NorQ protein